MKVINHTKKSEVMDFYPDEETAKHLNQILKERLRGVFSDSFLIEFNCGFFRVKGGKAIEGAEVNFHHKILNKTAKERWSIYYIGELVSDVKVLTDLEKRICKSFDVQPLVGEDVAL